MIADLVERTRTNMNEVQKLKQLSTEKLNWRTGEGSWSILECVEHLNLYGDFCLPEIEKNLHKNNSIPGVNFKSGFLGNFFAQSMLPKQKLNKMKTFKDKDPMGSKLDKGVLDRFLQQQKIMLELLDKGRRVNLEKTKTAISITRFVKLKLGDTFRVVIYHNERHIVQAQKVLEAQKIAFPGRQLVEGTGYIGK